MVENVIRVFVLSVFCFSFFSFKLFSIFQQCTYRSREFALAIFKENKSEICRLSTYSLVFCVLTLIASSFYGYLNTLFWILLYLFSFLLVGLSYFRCNVIKQQAFTRRYVRIYITSCILCGLMQVGSFILLKGAVWIFAILYGIIPILSPLFIMLSSTVNFPYDKLRYELSKLKCKKRLAKCKSLVKIAITGSFGKTSVKNYLAKMLAVRYSVLATPKSYNTPLGVCKAVKEGFKGQEIFIVEMGARYKNDIKELCKMVKPNVGVITGITAQHTATLGDINAVKTAKNQLIEALSSDGLGVFSMQTVTVKEMYGECKCSKIAVGKSDCFVNVKDIIQQNDGISFTIEHNGKGYKTFAPLLGEHNAYNIGLSVAISLKMGVEMEKLLTVIPTLQAVEHRAQIIKTSKGITVIDDGYNANLEGIKSTARAVGALSGYKIAVTSGIVELGDKTEEINVAVGKALAESFDLIIAVGVNASYVYKGAENREAVKVKSINDAQLIIGNRAKAGDVVAFFNDLPDRY